MRNRRVIIGKVQVQNVLSLAQGDVVSMRDPCRSGGVQRALLSQEH